MGQPETEDQRAERLLRIGLDMAVRIREEPPDQVVREMHGLDREELLHGWLLAAACIPIDRHYRDVIWWADNPRLPRKRRRRQTDGRPACGTRRAYELHVRRGELVDLACDLAERRRNNTRHELKVAA